MDMLSKEFYDELGELLDAELSIGEISKKLGIPEDPLIEQLEYLTRMGRKIDNATRRWKGMTSGSVAISYKSVKINECTNKNLDIVRRISKEAHEELTGRGKKKESYASIINRIIKDNIRLSEENEKLKRA